MSFTTNKSAIAEVRDQLSLDFADDEYLNTIGQNLGIHQHLFSFDDDIWRALIKTLGIEYKQVVTKFNDVLEILFGPKITEVGTLTTSVAVGEDTCFLNDTSTLPQVGTLLFDAGLATEETIAYRFIDRRYNEIVLSTPFTFAHIARDTDAEEVVLAISSAGEVVCSRTNTFPTADFSYTIVLDRGLPTEASYTVSANDIATDTLTVSSSPFGLHAFLYPTNTFGELLQDYSSEAVFITLESTLQFPESGVIRLAPTDSFTVSADGSGVSDKTLDVAASTFTADSLGGYEVVFDGNITSELSGIKRRVISNGTAIITLDIDFTDLGFFPHLSDTFTIYPVVGYSSNDNATNSLTLHKVIPSELTIAINSRVELLDGSPKVSLAPVQFVGSGWDIIQSTPKLVELYIPESIRGIKDLRSASYLHDDTIVTAETSTLTSALIAGDTQIDIATEPDFPDSGILIIDEGEAEEELVAYGRILSSLKEDSIVPHPDDVPATINTLTLVNSNAFPSSGSIVVNQGAANEETHVISANETETGILTLVGTLAKSHYTGEVVRHINILNAQSGVVNAHAISDVVAYYYPEYAGSLPRGDHNEDAGVHPGPYVYSIYDRAPSSPASSPTTVDYGNYQYDDSPSWASGHVHFNNSDITLATGCLIADLNLLSQDNEAALLALQVADWFQLDDVGNDEQMLFQVNSTPVDETNHVTFDIINVSFINGFAPTTYKPSVHITSWGGTNEYNLSIVVPGPTVLSIDQTANNTCVEVENALAMQESAAAVGEGLILPFDAALGRDTLLVRGISLANRVSTTTATADTAVGDTTMEVANLDQGNIAGAGFPAGKGYRVLLDVYPNDEVAYVVSSSDADDTLTFEDPLLHIHHVGDPVVLMKDVLTTDELILGHKGLTPIDQRSSVVADILGTQETGLLPNEHFNEVTTGIVRPRLDCIDVLDSTGLDTGGGTLLVNFGSETLPVKDFFASTVTTTLTLSDASSFPSTFDYTIEIDAGTRFFEAVTVTGKAGNILTISYALRYTHDVGAVVSYTPGQYEVISYDDIDANELCFNSPLMLEYTHYPLETIIPSHTHSDPRDDGFSFPLRLPVDLASRLQYILDLIRAAGVEVEIISER